MEHGSEGAPVGVWAKPSGHREQQPWGWELRGAWSPGEWQMGVHTDQTPEAHSKPHLVSTPLPLALGESCSVCVCPPERVLPSHRETGYGYRIPLQGGSEELGPQSNLPQQEVVCSFIRGDQFLITLFFIKVELTYRLHSFRCTTQ